MTPYRELVHACARGGTYKYFFDRNDVAGVWRRLESRYGAVRRSEAFKTMEIESDRLILRATLLMNPITVFRKRLCDVTHVEEFHVLVGYPVTDERR